MSFLDQPLPPVKHTPTPSAFNFKMPPPPASYHAHSQTNTAASPATSTAPSASSSAVTSPTSAAATTTATPSPQSAADAASLTAADNTMPLRRPAPITIDDDKPAIAPAPAAPTTAVDAAAQVKPGQVIWAPRLLGSRTVAWPSQVLDMETSPAFRVKVRHFGMSGANALNVVNGDECTSWIEGRANLNAVSSSEFTDAVTQARILYEQQQTIKPNDGTAQPLHSQLALSPSRFRGGLHTINVGARILLRGVDALNSKMREYANTEAEITEVPSHPNTWYSVRLNDGKDAKLRKSAFDVVQSKNGAPVAASAGAVTAVPRANNNIATNIGEAGRMNMMNVMNSSALAQAFTAAAVTALAQASTAAAKPLPPISIGSHVVIQKTPDTLQYPMLIGQEAFVTQQPAAGQFVDQLYTILLRNGNAVKLHRSSLKLVEHEPPAIELPTPRHTEQTVSALATLSSPTTPATMNKPNMSFTLPTTPMNIPLPPLASPTIAEAITPHPQMLNTPMGLGFSAPPTRSLTVTTSTTPSTPMGMSLDSTLGYDNSQLLSLMSATPSMSFQSPLGTPAISSATLNALDTLGSHSSSSALTSSNNSTTSPNENSVAALTLSASSIPGTPSSSTPQSQASTPANLLPFNPLVLMQHWAAMINQYVATAQPQVNPADPQTWIGIAVQITAGEQAGQNGVISAVSTDAEGPLITVRINESNEEVTKRGDQLQSLQTIQSMLMPLAASMFGVNMNDVDGAAVTPTAAGTTAHSQSSPWPFALGTNPRKSSKTKDRSRLNRMVVGKHVEIKTGKYERDIGMIVKGSNGYFTVRLHRRHDELNHHENCIMKRSSDLQLLEGDALMAAMQRTALLQRDDDIRRARVAEEKRLKKLAAKKSKIATLPAVEAVPVAAGVIRSVNDDEEMSDTSSDSSSDSEDDASTDSSHSDSDEDDVPQMVDQDGLLMQQRQRHSKHRRTSKSKSANNKRQRTSSSQSGSGGKKRQSSSAGLSGSTTPAAGVSDLIGQRVRIRSGKHEGELGTIKSSGHGFYCVAIDGDIDNDCMKRLNELDQLQANGAPVAARVDPPAAPVKKHELDGAAMLLMDISVSAENSPSNASSNKPSKSPKPSSSRSAVSTPRSQVKLKGKSPKNNAKTLKSPRSKSSTPSMSKRKRSSSPNKKHATRRSSRSAAKKKRSNASDDDGGGRKGKDDDDDDGDDEQADMSETSDDDDGDDDDDDDNSAAHTLTVDTGVPSLSAPSSSSSSASSLESALNTARNKPLSTANPSNSLFGALTSLVNNAKAEAQAALTSLSTKNGDIHTDL